jgi:Holliday junction DNA helicase RuvB
VRDYVQVDGERTVTLGGAGRALDLLEVDHLGLDLLDRRIIETVVRKFGGGPVGLDTLAAAVSEEPETLEDVYEPYLMQLGFLHRTPRGRMVTRAACDHLGLPRPGGDPLLGG